MLDDVGSVEASVLDEPTANHATVAEATTKSPARIRGKSFSMKRISLRVLNRAREATLDVDTRDRPRTWADCVSADLGSREMPCPYAGCRHHLALTINERTGSIKFNRVDLLTQDEHGVPDVDLAAMEHTCSLRAADDVGGMSLESIGKVLNITREWVRAFETTGLAKLKALSGMASALDYIE